MSTLLVASAGGHLAELHHLLPRLQGIAGDVAWVTFETPQSRSLLAGRDVYYVPYLAPRDLLRTLSNGALAHRFLSRRHFSHVVSTGSAIAVSFLPVARIKGSSCHYIESATRVLGPSLTARLLRAVPGVHFYAQCRNWLHPPWHYSGSVFDGFAPDGPGQGGASLRRIVVTVGSMETFGFRALIEKMVDIIPPHADVLWQTGHTDVTGLPIAATPTLPADQLEQALRAADVVVAHAGVGSSLAALSAGRCPVLVPRSRARGEHVDDHQQQVAEELASRGLALARRVEDLTREDLIASAATGIVAVADPAPFPLLDG